MKLLLIFGLIAACSAFDFDCLKGPSFWCSSFANAQKCNKITECFMKDKNQLNNVNEKDNSHHICKEFVNSLNKRVVEYNSKDFNNFLNNNICDVMKGGSQNICKSLVAEYGSFIWSQLGNNNNVIKICRLLHNKERASLLKEINQVKINSPELCAKCKEFFKILESLFSKVTPDEIKLLLETLVCNQLPGEFRSMCKMLVEEFVGQLYELIKSLLDGDRICPLLHFCTNSSTSEIANSWTCDTCLDIVVVLKKDLVNVPASNIESLIGSVFCSKLPFIARRACYRYVGELIPPLIDEIKSNMTAQVICTKNQLCENHSPLKLKTENVITCGLCELAFKGLNKFLGTSYNIGLVKSFLKTKVCTHLKSLEKDCSMVVDKYTDILIHLMINHVDSNAICIMINACHSFKEGQSRALSVKDLHHQNHNLKGVECEACHFAFERLKKFITDPNRETQIKNFLKAHICKIFPSDIVQCQNIIDQYFNIVLNFILAEFDVDKICQILNMCPTKVNDDLKCEVCENLMNEVINIATSNRSEEIVKNLLINDLCPHLKIIQAECKDIVKQYLPYIFELARSSLNGKLICSELHLCTMISQYKNLFINLPEKKVQCEICQLIINETRVLLSNPEIQTSIENFIKKDICSHFGSKAKSCVDIIDQYFMIVVNVIVSFLNPALCSEIGLCSAQISQSRIQEKLLTLVESKKIDCPICVKFYKYMKSINERDSSINTVLGVINLCNQGNNTFKTECLKQFRDLEALIKLFNKSKNMWQFCKMTKMCSKQSQTLIGTRPCTWGPSFWCISRQHALLCGYGAVNHCETNVWNKQPIL